MVDSNAKHKTNTAANTHTHMHTCTRTKDCFYSPQKVVEMYSRCMDAIRCEHAPTHPNGVEQRKIEAYRATGRGASEVARVWWERARNKTTTTLLLVVCWLRSPEWETNLMFWHRLALSVVRCARAHTQTRATNSRTDTFTEHNNNSRSFLVIGLCYCLRFRRCCVRTIRCTAHSVMHVEIYHKHDGWQTSGNISRIVRERTGFRSIRFEFVRKYDSTTHGPIHRQSSGINVVVCRSSHGKTLLAIS